jgi:phosphatidylinositol 4-kinase
MDADSKLLTEFLSYLQADAARLAHEVSSLGQTQATSMNPSKYMHPFCDACDAINLTQRIAYISRLKTHSLPLKLLVENEIYRLSVWLNPVSDPKRGVDHPSNLERSMTDVSCFQRSSETG